MVVLVTAEPFPQETFLRGWAPPSVSGGLGEAAPAPALQAWEPQLRVLQTSPRSSPGPQRLFRGPVWRHDFRRSCRKLQPRRLRPQRAPEAALLRTGTSQTGDLHSDLGFQFQNQNLSEPQEQRPGWGRAVGGS